ncbi:unnamed protein product, partial [Cylindrotheca closterium]
MPTTRSGMNSTPAPPAGAANQPVSPATSTVGNTAGTPANATAPPGRTLASLEFAVTTLFREPLDSPLMRALRRDGCLHFMHLLSYNENELLALKYDAPIIDQYGVDTGQTQLTQLERPHRGTLRALLGYAYLRQNVHGNPITPINCMNIDVQAFFNYQCSGDFIVFNKSLLPQPLVPKPAHCQPVDSSSATLLPTQKETSSDSHLATVRNEFAPKHGELQRPMSDESDRQSTVDVKSNQYSDTTSPTTNDSSALQPSICTSDGINILTGGRADQLISTPSTMSRLTLDKLDITHHVTFDSKLEWDQTLLDPNIDKLGKQIFHSKIDRNSNYFSLEWDQTLLDPHNGDLANLSSLEWDQTLLDPHIDDMNEQVLKECESQSDRVGILRCSQTILTLNEASEDETPKQLDDFDTAMDGIGNATLVSNLDWDQTLLDPNIGNLGRSVSANSTRHGLLLQLTEASMGSDSDALLPEQDETEEYPMDLENGEQQCVMSDKLAIVPATKHPLPTPPQEAKQHELTFDGVKYRSVNNHTIICSIQKVNARKHLALIDRGANGGIAGDDARIIHKSNCTVDVQGIDNHQVADIPIVTSSGLIHTQRGPTIAIMHQRAYIGKGQTILSSGQMEHFKIVVDDKFTKAGGQQRLATPPNYNSEDEERPFDLVGVLKNNKALTSFKEPKLDGTIDYFQNFNCVLPTDGLYEQRHRASEDLTWFDCNMADLFGFDASLEDSPIPECFEVYEACKRPSVLFDPGQPVNYDIESATLEANSFKDLILDSDKPTLKRNPRHKAWTTPHGESDRCPPPRVHFDDTLTVHESSSQTIATIKNSTLEGTVAFLTDFVLEDDLLQQLPETSMGRDDATSALSPVHGGNKSDRESDQTIDEIVTNESILVCALDILEDTLDCTLDFLEPLDFDLINRGLSTANIPNATLIPKHCTDHDRNGLDSTAIGTGEAKPAFNQVDSHNCNRALPFTTMNGHSALDSAINFFQSFAYANPIDGLHDVHPPPTSELARLERSMEDPINLDRTSATQVAPPELEIYQSHKQPSTQEARFELVLYQSHQQSSAQEARFDDDTRKPDGRNGPPPCNSFEHGLQPTEVELKNPSSAVKSRERDWERLRSYFAWLPKLVIQKNLEHYLEDSTQLATITTIDITVLVPSNFVSTSSASHQTRAGQICSLLLAGKHRCSPHHGTESPSYNDSIIERSPGLYHQCACSRANQSLHFDGTTTMSSSDDAITYGLTTTTSNGIDLCHCTLTVRDFLHWTYIDEWRTLSIGRKQFERRLLAKNEMVKYIHIATCLSTNAFYMKQLTTSTEDQMDSDRIVAQIHGEQTTGLQPLLEGNEPLLDGLPWHITKQYKTKLYQLHIWHTLLPLHHMNKVFHLQRFSLPHIDGPKATETVANS